MQAIAHGGCTDTVRQSTQSTLWEKSLPTPGTRTRVSIAPWLFSRTLYHLSYPHPCVYVVWIRTTFALAGIVLCVAYYLHIYISYLWWYTLGLNVCIRTSVICCWYCDMPELMSARPDLWWQVLWFNVCTSRCYLWWQILCFISAHRDVICDGKYHGLMSAHSDVICDDKYYGLMSAHLDTAWSDPNEKRVRCYCFSFVYFFYEIRINWKDFIFYWWSSGSLLGKHSSSYKILDLS